MRVIAVVLGPLRPLGLIHMDAYLSNSRDLTFSDGDPILIAATSEAAMMRAERSVQAAGLRIGAKVPVEQAAKRLADQLGKAALWIEIDCDAGGPMDDLLDLVASDVRNRRYAAVVSTTAEQLDPVIARLDDMAIETIVNGDEAQRAAALAIALRSSAIPSSFGDAASDRNAERLRQLSEEVGRIASTLARLSAGPGFSPEPLKPAAAEAEIAPLSGEVVRKVIRARRLRANYFSEELFADPAWDMMLDLLQAEIAQLRVPVSSLCIAAAVPATTALRWLKTLVAQQLFVRRSDPHDGRRVFVELAPDTSKALRRYFTEVGHVAVI
jgi:DNA-binding MarR family transcriptional regulator